jgi:hypothetical protein
MNKLCFFCELIKLKFIIESIYCLTGFFEAKNCVKISISHQIEKVAESETENEVDQKPKPKPGK